MIQDLFISLYLAIMLVLTAFYHLTAQFIIEMGIIVAVALAAGMYVHGYGIKYILVRMTLILLCRFYLKAFYGEEYE